MALLATQRVTPDGIARAMSPAGAHEFEAEDNIAAYVANSSAVPITVTVPTPATLSDVAVDDIVVSVPASGGNRLIALPRQLVRKANGRGDITFSATESVAVAIIGASRG